MSERALTANERRALADDRAAARVARRPFLPSWVGGDGGAAAAAARERIAARPSDDD